MAVDTVTPVFVIGCNPLGLSDDANVMQSITRLTRAQTPSAAPVGAARAAGIPCSTGFLCLTPDNLEGRVYSASLMVGGNGNEVGYAVTTVGATEEVRRRPDLGIGGELTFNINTSTDLSGDYTCCGGTAYPSDANAVVRRLEFTWDYLDATFTVPETAGSEIAGTTHTIRLVYVSEATVGDVRPDTTATLLIGDKLVRSGTASTFSWCDATACGLTERPQAALTDSGVTRNTREGNGNYAIFAINLVDGTSITFTEAEALEGNWIFTVAFDVQDAMRFAITDWSDVNSVQDLVDAFVHFADHTEGATSIGVALSKEQIGGA